MGVVRNIDFDSFPTQSRDVGSVVEVCFHYDPSRKIRGVIVRDDTEEPGRMIIRLGDGRYVLSTECQYSPVRKVRQ